MRLYEYEAKTLLREAGILIPEGKVVSSIKEIEGDRPSVVKAQIPVGGREKAGGVFFCSSLSEIREKVSQLLGSKLRGYPVAKVLIEEQVSIDKAYFLAVTYDTKKKEPVVLFSTEGGIDIEEVARLTPMKIIKRTFSYKEGFFEYQAREIAGEAGLQGKELLAVAKTIFTIIRIFLESDAIIVEINPLAITKNGELFALDAHIELDDDALYRHLSLQEKFGIKKGEERAQLSTEFEKKAMAIDALDYRGVAGRLREFDGNLGLLIGGGGASLTIFDAVKKYGGKPANYCEIGGNPSVLKVKELTKLLLSKKKIEKIAVIMNIVSNTRVDLIARGLIKGIIEAGKDPVQTIAVFRVPGAWEKEGFKILRRYRVEYCDREVSIDQAARIAVGKVKN